MRYWMICYDISDNTYRKEVAEKLAEVGAARVQESVFEGWFERRDINQLLFLLSSIIEADGGSLRIYPIKSSKMARRAMGVMPEKQSSTGYWLC